MIATVFLIALKNYLGCGLLFPASASHRRVAGPTNRGFKVNFL